MTEIGKKRSQRAARALAHLPDVDPGLASLAIWCDTRDSDLEETVTSGDKILVGTAFPELVLQEQIGVLGHHILHVALRHERLIQDGQSRSGEHFDTDTYTLCADAIVNEILVRGGHAIPRPSPLLRDLIPTLMPDEDTPPGDLLSYWDMDRLYGRMKALADPSVLVKFRKDHAFSPDIVVTTPDPLAAEKAASWRTHILRAQNAGGAMGRGIGSILRALPNIAANTTPWERKLRRLLNNALNPLPRHSYRRPRSSWIAREAHAVLASRPTPVFEPAVLRQALRPKIVVGFDTSGSITPGTLSQFAGEVVGLAKKTAAELHVLFFDEDVYAHRRLSLDAARDVFQTADIRRDGGTSFVDVLAQADALAPSVIVMLSDGLGTYGKAPAAPVIWARPKATHPRPAFGDVLDLVR